MRLSVTANFIGIACLITGQGCQNPDKTSGNTGKLNLLFIWTDEQQSGTMGVYGKNKIKTLNFDKLAEESFVLM